MRERLRASSLRTRLIAALVLTTAVALGASFFALHERTGADLNDRVDEQLGRDLDEFRSFAGPGVTDAAGLRDAAQRFVQSQGYHADSRIFAIELSDGTVVTNEPRLLDQGERGRRRRSPRWRGSRGRRLGRPHRQRAAGRCSRIEHRLQR